MGQAEGEWWGGDLAVVVIEDRLGLRRETELG